MKIEVVPIFHPAYLLRNPIEKKTCMGRFKKIYMIIKRIKFIKNG